MPLPPSAAFAMRLAAQVTDMFIQEHRLAYAHVAPDLTLVYTSPNFEALTLAPAPVLPGCSLPAVLWEFVGFESALDEVLRGESKGYHLAHINRLLPDGTIAYLNFHLRPLEETDPGQGLLLLVEDVTLTGQLEQRLVQDRNMLRLVQAEMARINTELERLSHYKSFMLSLLARDIRTPLTAIIGYAQLLEDALPLDNLPQQREDLAVICSQADQIKRQINDLLSYDEIEQGKLALEFIPCDINNCVREVAQALEATLKIYKLGLALNLSETPPLIEADPQRLWQIVSNLISHAANYTPKNGQIRITTCIQPGRVILQVTDGGPGMSADQLDRLFQPEYALNEEARPNKLAYSRVGLFITKTLVETQDGQIEVSSQPDHGSTFTVTWPLHASS